MPENRTCFEFSGRLVVPCAVSWSGRRVLIGWFPTGSVVRSLVLSVPGVRFITCVHVNIKYWSNFTCSWNNDKSSTELKTRYLYNNLSVLLSGIVPFCDAKSLSFWYFLFFLMKKFLTLKTFSKIKLGWIRHFPTVSLAMLWNWQLTQLEQCIIKSWYIWKVCEAHKKQQLLSRSSAPRATLLSPCSSNFPCASKPDDARNECKCCFNLQVRETKTQAITSTLGDIEAPFRWPAYDVHWVTFNLSSYHF